jgi:hypothetical protein
MTNAGSTLQKYFCPTFIGIIRLVQHYQAIQLHGPYLHHVFFNEFGDRVFEEGLNLGTIFHKCSKPHSKPLLIKYASILMHDKIQEDSYDTYTACRTPKTKKKQILYNMSWGRHAIERPALLKVYGSQIPNTSLSKPIITAYIRQ